jgi:hypothetical protein
MNKWKTDANGVLELKDGNPIFVNSAGQEQIVGGDTISRLNGEAKTNRERAEKAEGDLKVFAGLDPVKAKEALELVGKLDQKKLIDAGEVDRVRKEIQDQYSAQIAEKDKGMSDLQAKLDNSYISDVFKSSKFLNESLAVPKDFVEAAYRNNFKVEEGKVVSYGKDGNKIYSKTRLGELADTEEALQILIESHAAKETILKANVGNGTGNNGNGGNQGKSATIKRADYDKLPGAEQAAIATKGETKIID